MAVTSVWVTGVTFVVVVSAADARNLPEKVPRFPFKNPENTEEVHPVERIALPVSYSYFTSRDLSTVFPAAQPTLVQPPDDAVYQDSSSKGSSSVLNRKTVRFSLNTVLPGNSINFDHYAYPELLQAVNTFSELTPSRKPQEDLVVTHNTVSLPQSEKGVTAVASRTRITNREKGNYPYREFTETTHNATGQRGSVVEREQHLRIHQDLGEDPFFDIGKSEDEGKNDDENDYK